MCAEGHPTACKLLDGWTITHHCCILSTACNLDAIQIFTRGCIAAERLTSTVADKGLKSRLTIIAPMWTYGLELWGCASKSNIAIIQRFQSKLLRAITDAPWYITNAMIHSDLGIPTVQDVIHDRSNKHRAKLQSHPNPLYNPYQATIFHGD
jgi:hypothetical protein